jgi:hypothetical protein
MLRILLYIWKISIDSILMYSARVIKFRHIDFHNFHDDDDNEKSKCNQCIPLYALHRKNEVMQIIILLFSTAK